MTDIQESMKKKAKKKKKSAAPKPPQPTLLGYKIINECTCGKKVELFDRQEMFFDHVKQQWFRLCEDCIEKNKTKKPVTKGPLPPAPQPPPLAIRKVLEIRP
jgi:hypothetical protein